MLRLLGRSSPLLSSPLLSPDSRYSREPGEIVEVQGRDREREREREKEYLEAGTNLGEVMASVDFILLPRPSAGRSSSSFFFLSLLFSLFLLLLLFQFRCLYKYTCSQAHLCTRLARSLCVPCARAKKEEGRERERERKELRNASRPSLFSFTSSDRVELSSLFPTFTARV